MFAKLFASMYDGTLCSRGPWQALVTFQQMLILCDAQGVVDMTAEAIARRTSIPVDVIKTGIEALEQPDPDSRSPDDDGRRIRRLDEHRAWGWQVVNHAKYRDMRSNEDRREYFRNYKREQRARQGKSHSGGTVGRGEKKERGGGESPEGFDAFWSAYPKKVAKPAAQRAFKALGLKNGDLERVLSAVRSQAESEDWTKDGGRFIPHPATWLNQRRFEDQAPQVPRVYKPGDRLPSGEYKVAI